MFNNDAIDLSTNSQSLATGSRHPEEGAAENKAIESVKLKTNFSVLPTFLPPCRICNATASGYHYGANTCEPCKAFFCRSLNKKSVFKPCPLKGKCADNPNGRIKCSECRYKKCIEIGMTKEGVKKGRYTSLKRTEDTKEVNRIRANNNLCKSFDLKHCFETSTMLVAQFHQNFKLFIRFYTNKKEIDMKMQQLFNNPNGHSEIKYYPGNETYDALIHWCKVVNEGLLNMEAAESYQNFEEARKCVHETMFSGWAFQVEKLLSEIACFTKSIPGFSDLDMDDRVLLLKQGRAEALHVLRHPAIYVDIQCMATDDLKSGDLLLVPMHLVENILGKECIDSIKLTVSKLNKLRLNLEDTAVLIAFIMCTPDRVGLQRSDIVEKMQDSLLPVLQYTLKKNHPDNPNIFPELLLFLPLLRQNSEINSNAMKKLRYRVNREHHPLLFEMLQE